MTSTIDRPDGAASGTPGEGDPAGGTTATRSYRYPGSPPFRDLEVDRLLFKGRDHESRAVLHSILSSELFLLYAVSGLGKSSLLNAGVMQKLRDRGYWPVSVRLNDPRVPPAVAIESQIIEAAAKDPAIDVERTPGYLPDPRRTPHLWDVLGSIEVWRGNSLEHLVVVLDQFEELFTLDWPDEVRRRFIAEFGEVVRHSRDDTATAVDTGIDTDTGTDTGTGNDAGSGLDTGAGPVVPPPAVKFVLVVREDALGELEALSDDVPQVLQHRFRLGPLDPDQALAAIREPALVADEHLATQRFAYSEEAAQQILHFLQHTERASASTIAQANRSRSSVDPSQLQIICQYVERRVLPTKRPRGADGVIEIEASDLGGVDGLRSILGDFYRRTVESFPESEQKRIRDLCEKGLISQSERRLSLESEAIVDAFGVPPHVLDELVDHRLVRAEPRVGSVYYELAHDTLVQPILEDRLERQRERARRRVRWIAIAVGVAAFVAAIVALVVAVNALSNDGDGSILGDEAPRPEPTAPPTTEPPPPPLVGLGASESGELSEPGQIDVFRVRPGDEPLAVVVEPSRGSETLNVSLAVTSDSGARRTQDQLGSGRSETIIIPAAESSAEVELAVSTNDASTGRFEVSVAPVSVDSLGAGGVVRTPGAINQPGDLAVFSVVSTSSVALDVEPQASNDASAATESTANGGLAEKGLDPVIEIIDADGLGRAVNDFGPEEPESTTIVGDGRPSLVVVRGYQVSVGGFEVGARPVDREVLPTDSEFTEQFVETGRPLEYAIRVRSPIAVLVSPEADLDPILEIESPDGSFRTVDAAFGGSPESVVLTAQGEHVVRVKSPGEPSGAFSIRTITVTPIGADAEELAVALPAALELPADLGAVTTVRARPDDTDEFLSLRTQDAAGFAVGEARAEAAGAAASLLVDSNFGTSGRRVILVSSDDREGTATVTQWSADPTSVDDVDASVPVAAPVVVDVRVAPGEFLTATASPAVPGDVVTLRVNSPEGFPITESRSVEPGEAATVVLAGDLSTADADLRLVATSERGDGEVTLASAPLEPIPLSIDGPAVSDVTSPAVLDLDVPIDDVLVFTARPTSPDEVLQLQEFDDAGFAIGVTRSLATGDSVSIVLDGRTATTPSSRRVVLTSSRASSTVEVELGSRDETRLAADDGTVSVTTPAIVGLDLPRPSLSVVNVRPESPEALVDVQLISAFQVAFGGSPSPGVPVAILIDPADVDPGTLDLIAATNTGSGVVTASIDPVDVTNLEVGQTALAAAAPALYEVTIEPGVSAQFVARTESPASFLTVQVYDRNGFLVSTPTVYQPLPRIDQLPADVIDLFSPEVAELFADGLPATVEEAIDVLNEAGRLGEVIEVLSENDIAADALLAGSTESTEPAVVSIDIAAGTYRVLVTSIDPETPIEAQLVETLPIEGPAFTG